MPFANMLNNISQLEDNHDTKTDDAKPVVHRNSYHGMNWAPLCHEIDLEIEFQGNCLKKKISQQSKLSH